MTHLKLSEFFSYNNLDKTGINKDTIEYVFPIEIIIQMMGEIFRASMRVGWADDFILFILGFTSFHPGYID